MRGRFQGIANILRFNWHFYLAALATVVALVPAAALTEGVAEWIALAAVVVIGGTTLVSLLVSWYLYDLSGLYRLEWLDGIGLGGPQARMANIHAGFDETSHLLRARYPEAEWAVMDFYDPARHTEVSIRRARQAHPPSPADLRVDTSNLPAADGSLDAVFLLLAAHEIRDAGERRAFFIELYRVLRPGGRVIVLEHLRDWRNFLAYTVGAFHFLGRRAWREAFTNARLRIVETRAPNPFMICFVLERDDAAP